MTTVSIIGIGRIGGGLAIALANKGYKIENLLVRDVIKTENLAARIAPESRVLPVERFADINSEIIFIATPDEQIGITAKNLARDLTSRPTVFHLCGALSSDVLSDLKSVGCPVGSIHPLVSVSDMFLAKTRFQSAFFAVEGDQNAVGTAKNIVIDLGGKPFAVETKYKTLYHAAAVTACGHLVALIDVALEMLVKCGLSAENAKQILLPLIKSTIENLETQTTAEALTGTFARADVETFQNHVESIENNLPAEILEIYLRLGARSLPLAERQGANPVKLEKMTEALLLAKNNGKC